MLPPPSAKQLSPAEFDRSLYEPLLQRGKFQDVLIALQPLVAGGPPDPLLLGLVADCYFGLRRVARGLQVLEAIVAHWPMDLQAWGRLGSHRLQQGDRSGAAAAFEAILTQQPRAVLALSALYIAAPYSWDSPHAAQLRQLVASGTLPQAEKISANNTLGKIAASAGLPDLAFAHFQTSKAATSGDHDPQALPATVADQINSFDPQTLPQIALSGDGPQTLFLVGLPGSGMDLLESLLLPHPDICTLGESPTLIQTRQALQHLLCQTTPQSQDWTWCSDTTPKLARAARHAYFNLLPADKIGNAGIAIDKLPQNLFEMGFARMILPEARFVFLMHHPLDLGLSLFASHFHSGHSYSHQLDWIGQMIRTSYAALDDYIPKLDTRLRLQSYRLLIEQPEAQMRAVLAHLDLDWEPACLSPTEGAALITTASLLQPPQENAPSGLGIWRRFETQLMPLVEALGGWDWIHAWEARDAALG